MVSQAVVFRKAEFAAPRTTDDSVSEITDRLAQRHAGGEPLHAATRERMEDAFGYDFSRVRVHRDAEAGAMSHQLSALAFTHGRHIYFGHGAYDPGGPSGSRLLAHELTHVVQQGQAGRRNPKGAAGPEARGPEPRRATHRTPGQLIQRSATWGAATIRQSNNLASAIINGTPLGVTWPTLNGAIFWSTAAARAALRRPTVTVTALPAGDAGPPPGFNATVATVPVNNASADETVLAAGPWSTNTLKATVGARFATLAACTGAGNSTFSAHGQPSDAAMFAANRRHENHHATDHEAAFNRTVVAWDARLTAAQTAATPFNGATAAAAESALHAAMGGTPAQIADAFMNACSAATGAYHRTAAGGVASVNNPTASADCSTSAVDSTNPS